MKRFFFSAIFIAITVIVNAQPFAIKSTPSTAEDFSNNLFDISYISATFRKLFGN